MGAPTWRACATDPQRRPLLLDPRGTPEAGCQAPQTDAVTVPEPNSALQLHPDCYVAWQGATADGLQDALATWFGVPATARR